MGSSPSLGSKLVLALKYNPFASEQAIAAAIYEELIRVVSVFHCNIHGACGDPETVLGLEPVEVGFLRQGSFCSYIAKWEAEGAALGHLKPPHINPSEMVISLPRAPKVVVEAVPVTEGEVVEVE